MSEDEKTPEWVEKLGEAIASTIEFQGPAYIEWYYSKAEDNAWGVDLIEFYPALIEIEEAGPLDGEIVFVRVNSFDILAAQNAFDEVDEVMFGFEPGGQPNVTLEGRYKGQEVIVDVYFEPASYEEDETE